MLFTGSNVGFFNIYQQFDILVQSSFTTVVGQYYLCQMKATIMLEIKSIDFSETLLEGRTCFENNVLS